MSYIQNRNLYQRIRGYKSQEEEDYCETMMSSMSIEDKKAVYSFIIKHMIRSCDPGDIVILINDIINEERNDIINEENNDRSNIISLYYSEIA